MMNLNKLFLLAVISSIHFTPNAALAAGNTGAAAAGNPSQNQAAQDATSATVQGLKQNHKNRVTQLRRSTADQISTEQAAWKAQKIAELSATKNRAAVRANHQAQDKVLKKRWNSMKDQMHASLRSEKLNHKSQIKTLRASTRARRGKRSAAGTGPGRTLHQTVSPTAAAATPVPATTPVNTRLHRN